MKIVWIIIITGVLVILSGYTYLVWTHGHKTGQIDSAIGLQYWHLYNHDNGTRTYRYVEDPHNIPERFLGYEN